MARLKRQQSKGMMDDRESRLRAAWMYYDRRMTQKEIAEALGLARTTIIRLLDEALRRGEVQIWIDSDSLTAIELGAALERHLGLDEAIIVPEARDQSEASRSVGAALGRFLSETLTDNMSVGVGWGRTLTASLAHFRPSRLSGAQVISLLGGMIESGPENTTDYAWQLASRMGAACYLYPAPLLVDSAETARILRERCGLDRLEKMAATLDMAVLGVGDIGADSLSLSRRAINPHEYAMLQREGAICDIMCHALDRDGKEIDHALSQRIMSVPLPTLAATRHLVFASGGVARAPAIYAAIKGLGCHTLVTDESAARALLTCPAITQA
ncbi:sugar-binding transcriptional regulator [Asaia sp. VD9]|uniref:sugar-binding transcriptional regulator n=1 Tax=Asaia sp. VD9 TaxID=3081235 RepID=UPI003015964A